MSRIIFCATVALLCCGAQAFGQGFYNQAGAHYQLTANPQQSDIPNPFDFSNQPAAPPTAPQAESSSSFQDPDSIPVSRQPSERSIVDTMVDHSMLMNTPHASYEPVDWCQTIATPNPVGEMMLREFCVDGLWDGYEAQRAHLCAHMWHKLSGHGCGGCGGCGSQCGCCGSQSDCGGTTVKNRYRSSHHGAASCGGSCDAGTCQHCAQVVPMSVQPASDQSMSPPPAVMGSTETKRDYFAELKASVNR